MLIKSLFVTNFRNLNSIEIKFNNLLNIIVGNNGQGKTNIIESIFLLTQGESFRYSKNENLITLGEENSFISSNIINKNLDFKINLNLTKTKKKLSVNDKISSVSSMKKFSAILFSPESLSVIKESSNERRQLIDQIVEQTTILGANTISDYKKVLKTRNRLLKDIAENKIQLQLGIDTLQSIKPLFLKHATELTCLRIKALKEMQPEAEAIINKISSKNIIKLDFKYVFSDNNYNDANYENINIALLRRMNELEAAELKIGLTLIGPQKHDVILLYNGNDSRFYCSQGQQRTIILAYKMAQIVYHHRVHGFYPILLLDDVLSELDLLKQESLISTLNETETQTFVTTTDISLLSKLSMNKANVFKVQNGQITI